MSDGGPNSFHASYETGKYRVSLSHRRITNFYFYRSVILLLGYNVISGDFNEISRVVNSLQFFKLCIQDFFEDLFMKYLGNILSQMLVLIGSVFSLPLPFRKTCKNKKSCLFHIYYFIESK